MEIVMKVNPFGSFLLSATFLVSICCSSSHTAFAHDVDVTLKGLENLTEIYLPIKVDNECFGQDRAGLEEIAEIVGSTTLIDEQEYLDLLCNRIVAEDILMVKEGCKNIYALPSDDDSDLPDELSDIPNLDKLQEPDLEYGELPDVEEPDIIGKDCTNADNLIVWNPQIHCREWTGSYSINAYLPIEPDSIVAEFGNNRRVNTEIDLSGAEAEIVFTFVGDRVDDVGCVLVHPFQDTMVYVIKANVSGLSGSVDLTLGLDPTNSTIIVEQIHTKTLDIEFDDDSLDMELYSNNILVNALEYSNQKDLLEILFDIVATYNNLSGGCTVLEDCVNDLIDGLIVGDDGFIINTFGLDSVDVGDLVTDLADTINSLLTNSLSISTNFNLGTGTTGTVNAVITQLDSSQSENTFTATYDITASSLTTNACGLGLTGFVAPPAGIPTPIDGDIVFTVPFSLVGEAGQTVIEQLPFCATTNFGGFAGQLSPNGNLTISRAGANRVGLSLPMALNAVSPLATGAITFNSSMDAEPQLDGSGNISLVLTNIFVSNILGNINIPAPCPGGINITVGGVNDGLITPCFTNLNFNGPALAGTIQTNLNTLLSGVPIPTLVQRSTIYIEPHVYVQAVDQVVDEGSLSLGLDIKDGSMPTDAAVLSVQSSAAHRDISAGGSFWKEIPLFINIKNEDYDAILPPVDLTITDAGTNTVVWLPPVQPQEIHQVPYTVNVPTDTDGNVLGTTSLLLVLDNTVSNIIDYDLENNSLQVDIDEDWFQPDYEVTIDSISVVNMLEEGSGVIESSEFDIVATVRNIGSDGIYPILNSSLIVSVNGTQYKTELFRSLGVAEEETLSMSIHVPEGPRYSSTCEYDVELETVLATDADQANNTVAQRVGGRKR